MDKSRQRLLVVLCLVLFSLSPLNAGAEFSPRCAALKKAGATVQLTASVETLEPLSESSLAQINQWLSQAALTLSAQEEGSRAQSLLTFSLDGQEAFSASVLTQEDYTLTAFPSGGAYLTAPDAPDALTLLAGEEAALWPLDALPRVYAAWAPALYPLLNQLTTPKRSSSDTSIKNAAASAAFENYTLTAEEMNAAWPRILETLTAALKPALQSQPHLLGQAAALLSPLTFSGECRFKRFLDQNNGDMGLQFTGQAALGQDVRKVTLYGGFTPDRGGYFSLALPAVKGKNNLKFTLTGKLTQKSGQNTLTLDSTYTRTWEGKTQTASLNASLKNLIKDEKEAWSGKVTLDTKEGNLKTTWTLTPDLLFTQAGLQGTLALARKEGKNQTLKATLSLSAQESDPLPPPQATAAKDLRGMTLDQARAVAARELIPLTALLARLMQSLPEETHALLVHDLRTEEWMNAPAVPVVQEDFQESDPYAGLWIVEEEE